MGDLTFPVIVVNGQFVGGADDLSSLLLPSPDPSSTHNGSTSASTSAFERLLSQPRAANGDKERGTMDRIAFYPPHAAKEAIPNLFLVPSMAGGSEDGAWYPRNWPWYSFQVRSYFAIPCSLFPIPYSLFSVLSVFDSLYFRCIIVVFVSDFGGSKVFSPR
jgi:hypothetical protein